MRKGKGGGGGDERKVSVGSSTRRRNERTRDELPRNTRPRLVLRKRVVELAREFAKRGKTSPRHGGEVVVLVVVADVVGEDVERTVVRPGLLVVAVEEVVLGDLETQSGQFREEGEKGRRRETHKVAGAGVETSRHVTTEEEVEHRVPPKVFDNEGIEGELGDEVANDPLCRSLVAHEAGSEGVEEDLEGTARGKESEKAVSGSGNRRTNQKNVFPSTVRSTRSSRRVGMSVSIPSSPRNCRREGGTKRGGNQSRSEKEEGEKIAPCDAQCGTF